MKLKVFLAKIVISILLLTNVVRADTPKMRVETLATNLEIVWSIAFAPDGRIFFTERPGRVRVFENGRLRAAPLFTVPDVELSGESGLMGMALHPKFADNHFLYLAYAYQASGKQNVKVVRYRETGETLTDAKTIVELIPAARYHAGTRLGFGPDGKLYITTGDATNQSQAQKLNTLGGKTLRLNDDGTIPTDNPFAGQKGARPEIWTYGHRNAQGMDWQPETGLMFQTEHGPSLIDGVSLFKRSGGDEVNIVEKGKNYGWAKISHKMKREGMETAILEYSPAIAPGKRNVLSRQFVSRIQKQFLFRRIKRSGDNSTCIRRQTHRQSGKNVCQNLRTNPRNRRSSRRLDLFFDLKPRRTRRCDQRRRPHFANRAGYG